MLSQKFGVTSNLRISYNNDLIEYRLAKHSIKVFFVTTAYYRFQQLLAIIFYLDTILRRW